MNITVDQSFYNPEEQAVEKEQSTATMTMDGTFEDNHRENPDPFLLTDSKVMTG